MTESTMTTETRRSSRRLDNSTSSSTTRGSLATFMDEAAKGNRPSARSISPVSSANSKKRTRQSESRDLEATGDNIITNRKRARPNLEVISNGTMVSATSTNVSGGTTSRDNELDDEGADIIVTQPHKKPSPLEARMSVIAEQYKKLAQALLESEIAFLENSIQEVKRGTCKEFLLAITPCDERRIERKHIAQVKLDLQKAQIEREWLANRSQAHFEFFKQRADLRSDQRRMISNQIFDIGREYSSLCLESSDASSITLKRNGPRNLAGPSGATLTEKDEDFLLMDIRPPTHDRHDTEIMSAVPVLDKFASIAAATNRANKPIPTAKKQKASKQLFSSSSTNGTSQTGPLPSITSIIKKDKAKVTSEIPIPPAKAHHNYFVPNMSNRATTCVPEQRQNIETAQRFMPPPSATFQHLNQRPLPEQMQQRPPLPPNHLENLIRMPDNEHHHVKYADRPLHDSALQYRHLAPTESITYSAPAQRPLYAANLYHDTGKPSMPQRHEPAPSYSIQSPSKVSEAVFDYNQRAPSFFPSFNPPTVMPQANPFSRNPVPEPLLHPFRRSDAGPERVDQAPRSGILWAGLRRDR